MRWSWRSSPQVGIGTSIASPAAATGGETAAAWDAVGNFNPVVPGYFADPTLKKFGDTYYLYTSTDGIGACEGWTQVWISKDMVNWVNYKMNWNPKDMNWAPDCMEKDGKYYLFYNYPCMTFAAEGDSPVGPWKPYEEKPFIPDKFVPPVITLDFQSFQDDDGATYGYFTTWAGNNDAGTGWVKFNDDMKTFESKGRIPYHQLEGIMEGPYMLKRKGKYYMMYSNASCHDATYNVRYSIHNAGPTAATGWIYGQNNPILSSDVPRKIHGTGHHSVLQENDDYFMIYHRHDIWVSAGGLTRQTCIDRMRFTADDQIEKVLPTHQGVGYFGENQNKFPNLARGASVVASSNEGTYFPRYATDDNNATLWRAETGKMNEWIEIDMGSVQKVRRTHLQFEYPEHVYQYTLKYSTDKTDWKVFADKRTNQKPGCPMVDDNDVEARYFRLTITNMEPIKNIGRRAGVWNFKAFSGIDPNYEALIKKYVNPDIDPALPPLLIEAGAGYGGTVSPSGMKDAWPKSDHVFTITANPGFAIEDVIVDGKSVGAVSSYSFKSIDDSHQIFARFKSENKETGSIPRTGDLLFSCLAEDLPEGDKIASWPTQFPKGGSLAPMSNPTVTRIDGRKFACINAAEGDGFRFGSARTRGHRLQRVHDGRRRAPSPSQRPGRLELGDRHLLRPPAARHLQLERHGVCPPQWPGPDQRVRACRRPNRHPQPRRQTRRDLEGLRRQPGNHGQRCRRPDDEARARRCRRLRALHQPRPQRAGRLVNVQRRNRRCLSLQDGLERRRTPSTGDCDRPLAAR
jgi:hypothetical protein